MIAMTIIDWIWWSIGSLAGLGGIVLTLRALFADRSRGRRRCPKCWYAMTGVEGLRCPECGRTAKRERGLLRTHRRWRVACVGVVLIIAGGGCFFGHNVQRKGWIEATPTIAYIVALPWLESDAVFVEMKDRVEKKGELAPWEYWWLAQRCVSTLENQTGSQPVINACRFLSYIEFGGRHMKKKRPGASWAVVSDTHREAAIKALVALLETDNKDVRLAAIGTLGSFERNSASAAPALLGLLADEDSQIRARAEMTLNRLFDDRRDALDFPMDLEFSEAFSTFAISPPPPSRLTDEQRNAAIALHRVFYQAVGSCGMDADCAVRLFRRELQSPDPLIRRISIVGLALLGDRSAEDLSLIVALADDDDQFVRLTVIKATSVFPYGEQVRKVLQRGLEERSNLIRPATLDVIGLREEAAEGFIDDVEAIVRRRPWIGLEAAATTLVRIGGDPKIAIDALLDSRAGFRRFGGLWTLAQLGIESEYACGRIRPLLESSKPDVKVDAGYAYAMLGGDREAASRAVFDAYRSDPRRTSMTLRSMARSGRMSVSVLREMLDSDLPKTRAIGAQFVALSGRAAEPALPRLRELCSDPDPDIARYAEESIRHIERVLDQER